jgi:hypothetical protein
MSMSSEFHTLYEFMVHTKGVIYVLMGIILVCFLGFWAFLTGREDEGIK